MTRKLGLTMLLCAGAISASAEERAPAIQLSKISRDLITPPQYSYTGAEIIRDSRARWLKIDAQFFAFPEFTDEVTFKYFILVGGKVLTGEVTHVNVPAGKELFSCMYVPPRALAHLLGNRAPTVGSAENIAVQVVLKGQAVDELSLNRARPQWYSALPAVPGLLLNKNETPFAPLFWDHYEQIKSASAR